MINTAIETAASIARHRRRLGKPPRSGVDRMLLSSSIAGGEAGALPEMRRCE
jgi:hypothetical protein